MRFSRAAPLGFVILVVIYLNTGESPSLERTAAEVTPRGAAPTALRAGFTNLPPPPPPLVAARGLAPPHPRFRDIVVEKAPARQPPKPAAAAEPEAAPTSFCTDLSCATRHTAKEPSWADLTFQPSIDWKGVRGHGTGVRGDCVATELEYIMPKYCDPTPRAGPFPSLERLASVDVHSAGLAQGGMAELVRLMGNRSLLVMGDSVMEQFYNVLQCWMRKERVQVPADRALNDWIPNIAPLWRMGKRKKPPKLPQRGVGGFRMAYARVTTMLPDEVAAAVATADVVLINWGLHYQKMDEYREALTQAFDVFEKHAATPGRAVVFQETGAQHFKASDRRGYGTGEWEHRDKSADTHCTCSAIEDFNVNVRNAVLWGVLDGAGRTKYPHLHILPFYNLTRPRYRWHFGNCTQRPNGWNYYTCCDCTHFCFSPTMWGAHLHGLIERVRAALASTA